MSSDDLLTTAQVAHRLGVKPATVYAYVSRGLLERDGASRHRHSLFSAAAVEALAGGARHPNRSGALEVTVETRLTALDPEGRLFYRGHDAVELARYRSFEDVAALLWDGPVAVPWEPGSAGTALISSLSATLAAGVPAFDLIPVAVAALATVDPERTDRRPGTVRGVGARMLAGVLALLGHGRVAVDSSVAARMWAALSPERPRPAQLSAVNAALILLADHELAASTFAARVAASAWADPYRVVLAGLGPIGGTLHGSASLEVSELLAQIRSPAEAFGAIARRAAAGAVPGFGHRVYRRSDPRAEHLLERLDAVAVDARVVACARSVLAAAEALELGFANVDFALAALLGAMGLPAQAGPTLFSFARMTGMLAHALEEYPHRLRFRPRATYVGAAPRT